MFCNLVYYSFKDGIFQMTPLLDLAESGPFNDFVHHFFEDFGSHGSDFDADVVFQFSGGCRFVPVNFLLQVAAKE